MREKMTLLNLSLSGDKVDHLIVLSWKKSVTPTMGKKIIKK